MLLSRLAAPLLLAVLLAGCQCGPGKACHADSDCAEGRCTSVGYCLYQPGSDAGLDAGSDAGPAQPDAGPPVVSLSTERLDFGAVGCGMARGTLSLGVHNDGGQPLVFSALVNNPLFEVTGLPTTVAPGQTAQLMVSAHIPATSPADIDQNGTLTLTTNDPSSPSPAVALLMRSSGITLSVQPALVSFGVIPVSAASPQVPLVISNLGNVEATLTIDAPRDPQFSLFDADPPIVIPPGGAWSSGAAGFSPARSAAFSTVATIHAAQPVCGASVMTIGMAGQGTSGAVGISTGDVFFGANGRVSCGTQAAAQPLTLSNSSAQPYSYLAVLEKGASSPFTVTEAKGSVPANGSVVLTIASAPIPQVADTSLEAYGDVLTILTGASSDPGHAILLHQSAGGAVLKFDRASIDFGSVPIRTSATAPLSVLNLGSQAASVTLSSSNAAFTTNPVGAAVANPGVSAFTAAFSPGISTSAQSGSLTMKVGATDVLCAPLPAGVSTTGLGTTGTVSYSPLSIDFGAVDCGTTAPARTVSFTNPGPVAYGVTATLALGDASPYTVSPGTGTVSPGGTLTLTVTPKAVPATSPTTVNLYGDTLRVSTDIPSDPRHDIPLRETAHGAIFSLSSTALSFGSVAVGGGESLQFSVTNSGNASGTLSFIPAQPGIFSLGGSFQVPGGGSSTVTASFTPMSAVPYAGVAPIVLSGATTLCQGLPVSQLSLDGSGAAINVVAVSASTLAFGAVACGATAGPRSFTVSNLSVDPLSLTYGLGLASPAYDVSGPASIEAGDAGVVIVTPRAVPAQADVSTDAFADTLTISATGPVVHEVHTVALHETAQGAILTLSPLSLTFQVLWPLTQTKDFSVSNAGNLAASYTLQLASADASFTLAAPDITVSAGASNSGAVTFSAPAALDLDLHTATVGLSTSTPLCAPLPPALDLSGRQ